MSSRGPRFIRTARKSVRPPRGGICCSIGQGDVHEPQPRNTPPLPTNESDMDEDPQEMEAGTENDPIDISSTDSCHSYDIPMNNVLMGIPTAPNDWPTTPVDVPVVKQEQRYRLHDMINCHFSIHKILCPNVLQRLGIDNDVELLLRRVGILRYVFKHVPTYAELTYEFWSSLQFHPINGGEEEYISFYLNKNRYEMSKNKLNEICRFPLQQEQTVSLFKGTAWHGQENIEEIFVKAISQNVPAAEATKTTAIIHPAFRYILKLIAVAINGNRDINRFTKEDTWLLYSMVYCNNHPIIKPCIATIIFRKMKQIINEGFHVQSHIPYGSLVTRIAKHFNVHLNYNFDNLKCLDENPRHLDLTRIYSARFIAVANNELHYLTHDIKLIPLPWKTRVTIYTPSWKLTSAEQIVRYPVLSLAPQKANPDDEDP